MLKEAEKVDKEENQLFCDENPCADTRKASPLLKEILKKSKIHKNFFQKKKKKSHV